MLRSIKAGMSRATTLVSVNQQFAISASVAVTAACVEATMVWNGKSELPARDFWPAFIIVGVIAAVSAWPFYKLPGDAGQEISGHRVAEPAPVKAVETAAQETPKKTATSGWGEPGNYDALPRATAAFSISSASSFESRFLGVALSRKSLAKSRHELVLVHLPSAALTHGA